MSQLCPREKQKSEKKQNKTKQNKTKQNKTNANVIVNRQFLQGAQGSTPS
jgi:hypothetical protein